MVSVSNDRVLVLPKYIFIILLLPIMPLKLGLNVIYKAIITEYV